MVAAAGAIAVAAGEASAEPTKTSPAETRAAPAGRSEVYVATGVGYYASDRRVLAGAGGGPGYRLHLTLHLAAYVEGQYLVYVGNVARGVLGLSHDFTVGPLSPLVGVQGSLYAGDHVDVLSSEHPSPPPTVAWAGQIRVAPLRFLHDPFTVMALYGDVGFGVDAKSRAFALSLSILDVGVRF
jgi:hypothetical protein